MVSENLAEPQGGMAHPIGHVSEVTKLAAPKCSLIITVNPCKKATAYLEKPSLPTPRVLWGSKKLLHGLLLIHLQGQNYSPHQEKLHWLGQSVARQKHFSQKVLWLQPEVKVSSQRKII